MQHALLHALIENGDGLSVLCSGCFGIAGGESLAHGAQAAAHLGAVGTVDVRAGYCLSGSLERGYVIRHETLFQFTKLLWLEFWSTEFVCPKGTNITPVAIPKFMGIHAPGQPGVVPGASRGRELPFSAIGVVMERVQTRQGPLYVCIVILCAHQKDRSGEIGVANSGLLTLPGQVALAVYNRLYFFV